jgi:HD-GYP domain-containing protein (c-di-GMP phosphodiesterase class II)
MSPAVVHGPETPGAADGSARGPGLLAPLSALDAFVEGLQRCEQAGQQLRLLLGAIADGLRGDAVFVCSLETPAVFETAGKAALPPEVCRQLLRSLVVQVPRERGVPLYTGPVTIAGAPGPGHAVLFQLSKSQQTWVAALRLAFDEPFRRCDVQFMELARRLLITHSRQLQAAERLKETLLGLIRCLTAAIDAKDPYTCGHSERVARIAVRLGQELKLPEAVLSDLYLAGLLHDVGKIGVEDRILRKPGHLTDEEIRQIQEHPVIGDRIISAVRPLTHVRPGVRNHHERFDGQGYPDRLAGLEIPLMARILAVADSCDAMMSARPYRPAMPPAQIEIVMSGGAGSQWDVQVVGAFNGCRHDLYGIGQRGIGESLNTAVGHAINAGAGWERSIPGNLFTKDSPPVPVL